VSGPGDGGLVVVSNFIKGGTVRNPVAIVGYRKEESMEERPSFEGPSDEGGPDQQDSAWP
jgi:hypothetical protein